MFGKQPLEGASFLVRMWRNPDRGRWYGQVEHIQTGEKVSFDDMEKIADICRAIIESRQSR